MFQFKFFFSSNKKVNKDSSSLKGCQKKKQTVDSLFYEKMSRKS